MFIMLMEVIVWCLNAMDESTRYIMDYETIIFMICLEVLAATTTTIVCKVINIKKNKK